MILALCLKRGDGEARRRSASDRSGRGSNALSTVSDRDSGWTGSR